MPDQEDRNRWPYVDGLHFLMGATVWAFEGGRVNVIPADDPDLFGVHRHDYARLGGYGVRLPGRSWEDAYRGDA